MNRNENNTLDDILSAAKAEFSEKGFQSASLRRIVKNADVTTGAFYGYFKSKEELFDALVGEQYDTLMGMFCETQMLLQGFHRRNRHSKWASFPARE